MSQRSFLRVAVGALVLALATTMRVDEILAGSSHVVIRIYDSATIDEAIRGAAIRSAAAVVAEAGVSADWHDCTAAAAGAQCDRPRHARGLIVRLIPAFHAGLFAARGAVETRHNPDASGLILGSAVVESPSGAGALATIFMDRVQAVASRTHVPPASLLGRAIAHEVGHLLLRTSSHGRSGLMRGVWTDQELALDRRDDWLFASSDRHILRANGAAGDERARPGTD
jgi:hypothetical protein